MASKRREQDVDWRNPKLSSRVRVALYLYSVVGEGSHFYKSDVREALPGIEQIDRRMRELREFGWVIRNYKDSPTLMPNELLLEQVGARIWNGDNALPSGARVSSALKRQVLDRD